MTHSRATVVDLLATAGRHPRRDLGQNFVVDANTVRRIVDHAGVGPGDLVVEIGAGLGSLTLALAERGVEVIAIEVDPHLVPLLREVVAHHESVAVVEADAMTLDWETLLTGRTAVVVANLPYNVATPLVCDLLDGTPAVERLLVMVQREVADRMVAAAGSRQYGAVSVKIAYWAAARIVGAVPAAVFHPRPNVESALVELVRREPPAVEPAPLFELVRRAFNQRRKMLRRSLDGIVTPEQFTAAGIDPTRRPEQLDLDEWCRLATAVEPAGST